jgi:hypothetical protein
MDKKVKKVEAEVQTPNGPIKAYITIIRGDDKAAEIRFRKYCGQLLSELQERRVIEP